MASEHQTTEEVTCLFCGTSTPTPKHEGAQGASRNFGVSIVRCRACGKEAPYQLPARERQRARTASN